MLEHVDIFMVSSFFDKQFVVDINGRDFLQVCCGLVYICIFLLYNVIIQYYIIPYYSILYYTIL